MVFQQEDSSMHDVNGSVRVQTLDCIGSRIYGTHEWDGVRRHVSTDMGMLTPLRGTVMLGIRVSMRREG